MGSPHLASWPRSGRRLGNEEFGKTLVDTGRHFDQGLSAFFIHQFEVPRPDVNLGVGNSSHASHTAAAITALGVPCLTLRSTTERPITIEQGTNTLARRRTRREILDLVADAQGRRGRVPELWDGRAAGRILDVLQAWWSSASAPSGTG